MAYTTINKSTDHFNTKIYTGNSSSPRTITGVGFQPDFTWIKPRNLAYSHTLVDAVRGASGNGALSGTLISNSTGAPEGDTNSDGTITAFTSDGFTLTAGSSGSGRTNGSYNYASWNWKANGAGSVDSSTGSISATVSANATAGFSIINFTNPSSGNFTIPHGLGVAPDMLFFKCTGGVQSWFVLHKDLTNFTDRYLRLQTDVAEVTYSMQTQAPTSTLLYLNSGGISNANAETICYAFASKTGFSKFGSYIGNGNADGTFIYTGFKPAFVVTKKATGSADNWILLDNKRDTAPNPQKLALFANLNNVEAGDYLTDFLSNGFKIRSATGSLNNDNSTYIYMAFAEAPLVGSNNVPCTAR